jgi:hypothetical protein
MGEEHVDEELIEYINANVFLDASMLGTMKCLSNPHPYGGGTLIATYSFKDIKGNGVWEYKSEERKMPLEEKGRYLLQSKLEGDLVVNISGTKKNISDIVISKSEEEESLLRDPKCGRANTPKNDIERGVDPDFLKDIGYDTDE